MEQKCDICGVTENVKSSVFIKGDELEVDRIYHFCFDHWIEVYARVIDEFAENNEYKVNSYLKLIADTMIIDAHVDTKLTLYVDENGDLDDKLLKPFEIRKVSPYESED